MPSSSMARPCVSLASRASLVADGLGGRIWVQNAKGTTGEARKGQTWPCNHLARWSDLRLNLSIGRAIVLSSRRAL